jgi:hypothetical protein
LSPNESFIKDKPPKGKINISFWGFITSNIENVVFHAKPKNQRLCCNQMLWNAGMLGLAE